MNRIIFSHQYRKLLQRGLNGSVERSIKQAKLLLVLTVTKEDLGEDFLKVDTEYIPPKSVEYKRYQLEESPLYLLLVFQKQNLNTCAIDLFTTVRVATTSKTKYYRDMIGKIIDVVVEGE